MQAYFASLSDYNAGHLHGVWVDLDGLDEIEIQDEINAMLRQSRYPNVTYKCSDCDGEGAHPHSESPRCETCKGKGTVRSAEEWAVHDYDEFPDMGEFPSLESLVETARLINEHGDAWLAYLEHVGSHYATEDDFEEKRAGEADSEREWVENHLDETGALSAIPANLRYFFNYDAYLREMKAGGEVGFERIDGTVYAFWA